MTGATVGFGITAGLLAVVLVVVWASTSLTSNIRTGYKQWDMSVDNLSSEQVENARTIIAVGRGADMSDRAIVIALMTAAQESSLRNLDHGDRDSLGLFQQRPSQGWGEPDQLQDPVWASKAFYGVNPEVRNPGLVQIRDWEDMEATDAAQAVQRSAYPQAYAKWEPLAEEVLSRHGAVEPIG
ncbi:hypothetical protein GCM10009755_15930 [Brevibacterium samyangense]|uniref:Peptidoglycan-binding protein n=1 Tax=Brevibacterium samyangense TaxID=366888 RepID=A0ABN2TE80_9MICO